jgi:hypothetical protein
MSRLARALLAATAICCLIAPSVGATPSSSTPRSTSQLGNELGLLWTTVLQTPKKSNPFTGGSTCVFLPDGTLAPFGPNGAQSCTVQRRTPIFVTAWSTECSTFENEGTTEADLRTCAENSDKGITTHTVRVDRHSVTVSEVETGALSITLPDDNIFDLPAGTTGLSVAHGWVTLLNPLTVGTHSIVIHVAGTYGGSGIDSTINTTITVV